MVFVVEDEDAGNEAELLCYQIDNDEPDASIKIKQFMGQKLTI